MSLNNFMDQIRSFFGFRSEPPRNEFRNPIWGSDDDDDGDELYTRQQVEVFNDPLEMQREFTRHMQEMFNNFGSLFGDMKSFFSQGDLDSFGTQFPPVKEREPETFDSNRIRDYYLKPGYHESQDGPKQDMDLDGKISSQDISGLLKHRESSQYFPPAPFSDDGVPTKSYCQTIITTSITKPDGTIETRRIIKNGNEVTEETTTSTNTPSPAHPFFPGPSPIDSTNMMLSQLSSFLKNFY